MDTWTNTATQRHVRYSWHITPPPPPGSALLCWIRLGVCLQPSSAPLPMCPRMTPHHKPVPDTSASAPQHSQHRFLCNSQVSIFTKIACHRNATHGQAVFCSASVTCLQSFIVTIEEQLCQTVGQYWDAERCSLLESAQKLTGEALFDLL